MELPDKIKLSLARYYAGRRAQYEYDAREGLDKIKWLLGEMLVIRNDERPAWNKDAALEDLAVTCTAEGWHYSSSAGTFWFRPSVDPKGTIQCCEEDYLYNGKLV